MTTWISRRVVLLLVCLGVLASTSLQAHHSLAGVYALGKEAKIKGAFKAFRLINPHSSLRLDVKGPDGNAVEWAILGGSVQSIARFGLGKSGPNALTPGDEITVTYMPALDGKSPIGLLVAITYPDGHEIRFRVE